MPTTPNRGYRYPAGTNAVDVVTDLTNLATDVDTDANTIAHPPFCFLQSLAGTSYASGLTATTATLGTVVEDTNGMSGTANTITIKTAGRYLLLGQMPWSSNGTGNRAAEIWKNGTSIAVDSDPATTPFGTRQNLSTTSRCAVGDAITLAVTQNSGGALAAETVGGGVYLQALYVGA